MPDPTLYLFDGFNLLHASGFEDPRELTDKLASFVAERGARGVLVFDGSGEDLSYGPLEVRFAEHADSLLERPGRREPESRTRLSRLFGLGGTRHVRPGSSQVELSDLREGLLAGAARAGESPCAWRTNWTQKRVSG